MTERRSDSGLIHVPGGHLAYDVAGDGPPLLLIHAGITDRRMWDDVWDAFAARHRVIRYDMRGFGQTRMTEAVPYSNRADVIAVLDHFGIERAAVVGCSRAGIIVLDTAIEYPDRFSELIEVGAGVGGADLPITPEEEVVFGETDRLEEAGEWEALVDAEVRAWVDGIGQPVDRVASSIRERVREMDLAAYRDHAEEPLDQVIPLEPRAAGRLAEVTARTLVVVGDLDTPETHAASRLIAEGVRGARLVVLPGVAHLPPMERPAEFVELVEGFVAEGNS